MDHTFLPRSMWAADSKFLQQPADLYTSVVVTRSIPAGTCFGPCVLQNTFYDTIAFIAQKSCDKASKSYVFRVSGPLIFKGDLMASCNIMWARILTELTHVM